MKVTLPGIFLLACLCGILAGLKLLLEAGGLQGPSWWLITVPLWIPATVFVLCLVLERGIDWLGRPR